MKTRMDYFRMSKEELFDLYMRLMVSAEEEITKSKVSLEEKSEREKEIDFFLFETGYKEGMCSPEDAILMIAETSDSGYDYETLEAMSPEEIEELRCKAAMVDYLYRMGVEELDEDYDPEIENKLLEEHEEWNYKVVMREKDRRAEEEGLNY